jgi:hypothetical protein
VSDLTRSLNRLTRNLSLTQVALHTKPPAGLFVLNLEALHSAVEEAMAAVNAVASDTRCAVDSPLGEHTAALLADALKGETPDTVPESWKE